MSAPGDKSASAGRKDARDNRRAFAKSFGAAVMLEVLAFTALLAMGCGGPVAARTVWGWLVGPGIFAALFTGLWASTSEEHWPFWLYLLRLAYLIFGFVLLALWGVGVLRGLSGLGAVIAR